MSAGTRVGQWPVIGITAYEEQAKWNQWDARASLLPARYVRAVESAGGIALLIPVQRLSPASARGLLSRLDGVIFSGGPDVNPARYRAEPDARTGAPRDERDEVESALIEATRLEALPALAICRGLQLLNVTRGGSLVQHLPDAVGHEGHAPDPNGYGLHDVRVEPGTLLARSLEWERGEVPTHHHQAISVLGADLTAAAWAEDGTIEAVEDRSVPFLLGVQWHPEAGDDLSLFRALVAAATKDSPGLS
ncbi:MAG: gamma-glutamyl-gamma-aminobutyrate hydrolase family protein [Actinomycetota bacterium]|nr:gamma-glutamyl-gamma-aminobutyrate hydrolase family protein [Actinomycetota bacterium]